MLAAGCQPAEEIRSYSVERPDASANAKARTLAAMFFRPDSVWFFKVKGAAREVQKHKDDFDHFVRSARFTGDGEPPVTFEPPKSWRKEEGKAPGAMMIQRFATFRMGPEKDSLELTVVKLGIEAASIPDNINRWRRELGLEPIVSSDLDLVSRETEIHGVPALLVDMSGPGATADKGPRFARPHPKVPAVHAPTVPHFKVPEGWVRLDRPAPFAAATFEVRTAGQAAKVSVTPLSGQTSLLENVNRWRGQVGLEPTNAAELDRRLGKIAVGGKSLSYVDITGNGKRILGVQLVQGSETWYFTMKGPADLVGGRKGEFETFVKSIRLDGDKGANHE
jgi:hypothetical protein